MDEPTQRSRLVRTEENPFLPACVSFREEQSCGTKRNTTKTSRHFYYPSGRLQTRSNAVYLYALYSRESKDLQCCGGGTLSRTKRREEERQV